MNKAKMRMRWASMHARCEDEENAGYPRYGGRGIYVCEEWQDFNNFYIWCIENNIDTALQIDRIDNNGPYAPSNCRLVSATINGRNRAVTLKAEIFGEVKPLIEWANDPRCEVSYTVLRNRLRSGVLPELAIKKFGDGTPGPEGRAIEIFGETKNLRQWAEDSRAVVGHTVLKRRVALGWEPERSLTTPCNERAPRPAHNAKKFTAFNETKTIYDWLRDPRCVVPRVTLSSRLHAGWEPAKAITKPVGKQHGRN